VPTRRFLILFHPGTAPVPGATVIRRHIPRPGMVATTERDGSTWYECEKCGLLFDEREDAAQHEANCDAEDPTYIQ